MCRSAARKILQSFQSTIVDAVQAKDRHKEGIVSREAVQKLIEQQKVPELTQGEILVLMKMADRTHKGYVATDRFIELLQELVSETKGEVAVRQFALACKRQQVSLRQELFKFDTSKTGKLDKKTFQKAISQLSIQLGEDIVGELFAAGETLDARGQLDIKHFIDKVAAAAKYNPLQTSGILQLSTGAQKKAGATK